MNETSKSGGTKQVENIKHGIESFRLQDYIILFSITLRREGFLRILFLYQKPQRHICITEIKLYRRNVCLGSTELFHLGLVELEMDFRKCGPIPYFAIRNNLYTAIKHTQKKSHLLIAIYFIQYTWNITTEFCIPDLPFTLLPIYIMSKMRWLLKYTLENIFCNIFMFWVFCVLLLSFTPEMKTEGNYCLDITCECCEQFRSKFDILSCFTLSREKVFLVENLQK